ncbi:NAD(P)H-binding protein [Pseudarthrobacter sp. S9]|uniref:NAD(P)H-binding protein n=1 Tax=Pseudarthrobacter sp. S9 TaxID=3418421 RepID=UPI003D04B0A5
MSGSVPSRVLVIGATGQTGRLVVAAATRHGLHVRALARNVERARKVLPGVDIVQGDLEDPATLTAAVNGIDAIVFTHGENSAGRSNAYRRVDYGGVANTLRVLGRRPVRIALMTSINVTRADNGAYQDLLDWKRRSERLVRLSDNPYTIVRPGWFDMTGPRDNRLVLEQGCSTPPFPTTRAGSTV